MILSRIIGKTRLEMNERPSFLAAWLPVVADLVMFALIIRLIFWRLMQAMYVMQPSEGESLLWIAIVILLPTYAIVVPSITWAIRTRRLA